MAVEISPQQYIDCQGTRRQFCTIDSPFQPLTNLPTCITALYARNEVSISTRCLLQIRKAPDVSIPSQIAPCVWILTTARSAATTTVTLTCLREATEFIKIRKPIHLLWLVTACSTTLPTFQVAPHYQSLILDVNISWDMANLKIINISSMNFCVWQHLDHHCNESQLQHLASIPSVPLGQLYSHMVTGTQHIPLFSPEESTGDTDTIWTLFLHTGIYITAIRSLIPAGSGIFCCSFGVDLPD